MSELPHARSVPAERADNSYIFTKSFAAASTAGAGLVGGIAGAFVANYRYPTTIDYAEGIQANASLTFSPGLIVEAPITTGVSPNVPVETPFPDLDGLHTTIEKLQLNLSDKRTQGEYIGLLTNFQDAVVKPTADSILSHLAIGAGIGAATAAGISYAALRYVRRVKISDDETQNDIENLRADGSAVALRSADRQEGKIKHEIRRRKLSIAAASIVLLLGVGVTAKDAVQIESASSEDGTPLASILTDQVNELTGTRISGGADQINTVIFGINDLKKKADKPWKKGYKNLLPALRNYSQTSGKKYVNDPDIVRVAHVTDLHCNLANYNYYFGPMLKNLKPDIVAVTGDTQINSGTMFYEKSCIPGLQKMVKESSAASSSTIPIVFEAGNHDDKKPFKGSKDFYNLTSKNRVATIAIDNTVDGTVNSLTFVGEQDPRSTIWYPTTPVNEADQFKKLAKQGSDIANEACKLQEEGKAVIVMAHAEQAGYSTNTRGCASLNLNGHTHNELPVKSFVGENGRLVLQHTGGSASGAGSKFSIYEGPQQAASTTVFYYSKSQGKFVAYYTVTLHKDSTVEITGEELPAPFAPANETAKMNTFEDLYATKTQLTTPIQTKPEKFAVSGP